MHGDDEHVRERVRLVVEPDDDTIGGHRLRRQLQTEPERAGEVAASAEKRLRAAGVDLARRLLRLAALRPRRENPIEALVAEVLLELRRRHREKRRLAAIADHRAGAVLDPDEAGRMMAFETGDVPLAAG